MIITFDKKAYMKKYARLAKEKERKKQWRKDNPEYDKQWHEDNPEKVAISNKRWREKNPEYYKEYMKQYRKDNPEKAYKWHNEHKGCRNEYYRTYNLKWIKTDKGKAVAQRRQFKRRTRFKNSINTLTSQEWADILEEHNYRCVYCDVEFEIENMPTKDHIIPMSKGGYNVKENVVPACQSCNSKKNDKLDYNVEKGVI